MQGPTEASRLCEMGAGMQGPAQAQAPRTRSMRFRFTFPAEAFHTVCLAHNDRARSKGDHSHVAHKVHISKVYCVNGPGELGDPTHTRGRTPT